jgi:hypothetical protein
VITSKNENDNLPEKVERVNGNVPKRSVMPRKLAYGKLGMAQTQVIRRLRRMVGLPIKGI